MQSAVVKKTCRKTGEVYYRCAQSEKTACSFFEPCGMEGVCAKNLDPAKKPGSPEEITDLCFSYKAIEYSKI